MAGGLHCELARKGKHADIPSETQSQSEQKVFSGFCQNQPAISRVRVLRAPEAFQKNAVTFHNPSVQRHFRRFAPSLSRHFPSQEHPFAPISAGFRLIDWRIQLSHFREQLSCRKTVSVWAKTLSAFQKTVTVFWCVQLIRAREQLSQLRLQLSRLRLQLIRERIQLSPAWKQSDSKVKRPRARSTRANLIYKGVARR